MTVRVPEQIGGCRISRFGDLYAVRAPHDQPDVLQALRRAGARWDKGTRQWWVERRQIHGLVRDLGEVGDLFG